MKRLIAWCVLAACTLATVAAFWREDQTGGFETWCTERHGHLLEQRHPGRQSIQPGPHGPVVVGYPARQACIGPDGKVLSAR